METKGVSTTTSSLGAAMQAANDKLKKSKELGKSFGELIDEGGTEGAQGLPRGGAAVGPKPGPMRGESGRATGETPAPRSTPLYAEEPPRQGPGGPSHSPGKPSRDIGAAGLDRFLGLGGNKQAEAPRKPKGGGDLPARGEGTGATGGSELPRLSTEGGKGAERLEGKKVRDEAKDHGFSEEDKLLGFDKKTDSTRGDRTATLKDEARLPEQAGPAPVEAQLQPPLIREAPRVEAAEAAHAAGRTLPPDVIRQMVDRARVLTDRLGNQTMQIDLSSHLLGGGLSLDIKIVDGAVQATFRAETAEIGAMIENTIPELAKQMEAGGMKLGEASVDVGGGSGGRRGEEGGEADNGAGTGPGAGHEASTPTGATAADDTRGRRSPDTTDYVI
ncbi:MAG: flagellar hook-length control protein FliK [Candidatus Schekmanbacteria bacterium]|nr:flagellar hook-length control protein FliK [Candidatus Schekmanbacteria bacterium]